MPGDGRRHRLFVARDAGDHRRTRDLVAIELGDPAIGERIGRPGRVPSEQGRDHRRVIAGSDVTTILGEDLQEPGGEEVAMDVADLHARILDPEGAGVALDLIGPLSAAGWR